jgi:hypothetical protein
VFLEGALNNASYRSMCAALVRHAVGYTNVRCSRATQQDRLAAATINGSSMGISVSRGCSQCGVLSPLLWCLVFDDSIARFNGGGIYTRARLMAFVF